MNRKYLWHFCLLFGLAFSSPAQPVNYSYDTSGNLTQRSSSVTSPPQIIGQPQAQIVVPGELASFSVLLANASGCSYQWQFFGTNLASQTGDALLIRGVSSNNQGPYSVVVDNSSGSVTSKVAQLYIDSNANGIPDSWELTYFGNLNQNATGDFDGDGVSNWQEFFDGTNPTNKTSFRTRLTLLAEGGVVNITPLQSSYALTDSVTLTATPFSPNTFAGWSGDLGGSANPAILTMETNKNVRAQFICALPPTGMVGWWRGENNALDALGANPGTLSNGVSFAPGEVGQAFRFTAINQQVIIPASAQLNVGPGDGLTIEAWIKPADLAGQYPLVEWHDGTNAGVHFWINVAFSGRGGPGCLYANVRDTNLGDHYFFSPNGVIGTNSWQHVAVTYDRTSGNASLFLNGFPVASANLGSFVPWTVPNVYLGFLPGGNSFSGLLDEPTIYNRALAPAEILALSLAGASGKCATVPYLTSAGKLPDGQAGAAYAQQINSVFGTPTVNFSFSAGTLPAGLTISPSGLLSGVPSAAGSNVFALRATDASGLFSEKVFSLNIAPSAVAVSPPGLLAWWRAENNALDYVGAHHGSLSNGVTYSTGLVGQAFSFDGTNSYVVAPDAGLPSGNSPRTVEFWMRYAPGASGNHEPFFYGTQGVGSSFYIVIINNRLYIGNWGGGDVPGSTTATDGNWHHVALTHDGFTTRMYVDGQLDASSVRVYSTVLSGSFYMGALLGTSDRFKGQVDEMAVYNRALSDSEIAGLFQAAASGKVLTGPYFNTPARLPDGVVALAYAQTVTSLFGALPVNYSVVAGTLPPGLGLTTAGILSGTPTNAGAYSFTVRATDSVNSNRDAQFTVQVYAPIPPPPGLVSWWRAETNALDSVGTNNGAFRNGVTFGPGEVGQAFSLDGGSQAVEISDSPSLRPASVTLETWALFTATGTRVIMGKPVGSGFSDSYQIYISGGNLGGFIGDAVGIGPQLAAPFSPLLGNWYHLAYTFDNISKQQTLYVNGSQVVSGFANKAIGYDTQPMLLGRDTENGSPNYFFAGRLDESAVYNRALGSNEIAALFNAGPAGKTVTGPAFANSPVLPFGVVKQPYTQTLTLVRGAAPTFAVTGGSLPPGLNLSSAGALSGTPNTAGSFNFIVRAIDNTSLTADQSFTLQVLPQVAPDPGIVGWWRAENNALDSIGTNDGFLVNAATFAPGKVGQAFSLSGFNDAVEVEDSPTLRPTSVTLQAWVLFLSPNGIQSIIAKPLGSGIADSFTVWLENGNLRGGISDITGAANPIGVPFSPIVGQWYHVAFTFDDSTKQEILYLNGSPVAFGISNLSIGYDAHSLLLGADIENNSMALFLQGRIDEAALYNRALSAAEIATNYTAGAAGFTPAGPYFTTTPILPEAIYGVGYSQTIASLRGTPNVNYTYIAGTLPAGMFLSPQGLLSGTPTGTSGITPTNATLFLFTVRATDSAGLTADQNFSLNVTAPAPTVPGLTSWWRAENNALDSIGTNNGTALNGTAYAAGKVGRGFSLDGINDCIVIPDSPGLRPASLTLECWVMFTANNAIRVIFAKPLGGGILDSFALWIENGNLKGAIADATGSGPALLYPFVPVLEQWYHAAYSFDGATRQQVLYLNGVTVASGLADRSIGYDTNSVLLGCDSDNGNRAWFVPGGIDEAAIYNRALTASEIQSIYAAGAAGKQSTSGTTIVLVPSLSGNLLTLSFQGAAGASYTIESKSVLDSTGWSKTQTVTAQSGRTSVQIPITDSQQFYRARTGN